MKEEKVKLNGIITHRLPLTKIADGYSMFKKKEDNCVTVVLDRWPLERDDQELPAA
ncbi:MAG TPA: hypothetical protein VFG46_04255 [Chryseolinea sp.]|nr:hypothetical protein [Chryseolinea sp.]